MLTKQERERLWLVSKAATKGPWKSPASKQPWPNEASSIDHVICGDGQKLLTRNWKEACLNIAFILVARQAIPDLLSSLDEMERQIEQLCGDVRAAQADYGDEKAETTRLRKALEEIQIIVANTPPRAGAMMDAEEQIARIVEEALASPAKETVQKPQIAGCGDVAGSEQKKANNLPVGRKSDESSALIEQPAAVCQCTHPLDRHIFKAVHECLDCGCTNFTFKETAQEPQAEVSAGVASAIAFFEAWWLKANPHSDTAFHARILIAKIVDAQPTAPQAQPRDEAEYVVNFFFPGLREAIPRSFLAKVDAYCAHMSQRSKPGPAAEPPEKK